MEWKDLSEEAKGIIEWVVNPITNFKQTIEIKIGEIFHRKCPKYWIGIPLGDVNIIVNQKLYQEILKYVTKSEDMEYKELLDGLIFRLKDEVEV